MLEILINISNVISPIFYKILYMSIIGTIIGVIVLLITKFFDNKLTAKWKCIMWVIPLLFFMIPISRIQININNDITMSSVIDKVETTLNCAHTINYIKTGDIEVQENTQRIQSCDITINNIMPIVWLIGLFIFTSTYIIGNIKLKHTIRNLENLQDSRMKIILIKCKNKLNINKKVEIKLQNFNMSPCIHGIIRPKILISKDFIKQDNDTIKNVFMHELSHYKRKDMITNYFLLIITAIHWFNPIIYRVFKKIRQEMELATDEIALNRMNKDEKKRYGLTLINLLQTYNSQKVATKMLYITDDNKNMERRIKKIKISTRFKKYSMLTTITILIIILGCILPFIIKPVKAKTDEIESKQIPKEDIEKVEEANLENEKKSQILEGKWKIYNAKNNNENVPLSTFFGSGGSKYGGSIILNKDGTYSKSIGINSQENEDEMNGRYEVVGDFVYLNSYSGKTSIIKYIEGDIDILKEQVNKNTEFYYKK